MLDPRIVKEELRAYGIRFISGVPCSLLKTFIETVQDGPEPCYITATNEAAAVAFACGVYLGGGRCAVLMQNSGLGNAVNPLTSLNYIFKIPVLLFITLRGEPGGVADEPQHELMGLITTTLLDTMRIPWRILPNEIDGALEMLKEAFETMNRNSLPFALVVRAGTFSGSTSAGALHRMSQPNEICPLECEDASTMLFRRDALKAVMEATTPSTTVLIATTGYTGRELYSLGDHPNQFYMVGSMGCAAPLGLGLSLCEKEKKVVVLDGDGAVLMHMGTLAMAGHYKSGNFFHIVLDNGCYESTGGQITLARGISFAKIAAACGYEKVFSGNSISLIRRALNAQGPVFLHVILRDGTEGVLPRPSISPQEQKLRFMAYLERKAA